MKIALVHDALINRGGAERVFQIFCETFPDADIYTSVFISSNTSSFFRSKRISTSFLQGKVANESLYKLMFPLANYAMSKIDLNNYDLILSSSTFSAKYVCAPGAKHICYCYTPFRLLWQPESYYDNKLILALSGPFLDLFKMWDYKAAGKVDQFIAMTDETQRRILSAYKKRAYVVPPPIKCSDYITSTNTQDYFLVVSRLEKYKCIDLVIKTFNKTNLKLLIVGKGTQEKKLKKIANNNITFLGNVSDDKLKKIYAECKAVIFPQKEDYGLVPLEANASGKPVICFGQGGVETTMIPYSEKTKFTSTALFFKKQTVRSLLYALSKFESIKFDQEILINNAKKFNVDIFKDKIKNIVENLNEGPC